MNIFEKIAQERIEDAMNRGEFDNLPGSGQPIDLSDYFNVPSHFRIAYKILKDAGIVPLEVDLIKEIEDLKSHLLISDDLTEKEKIKTKMQLKSIELNILLERYHKRIIKKCK